MQTHHHHHYHHVSFTKPNLIIIISPASLVLFCSVYVYFLVLFCCDAYKVGSKKIRLRGVENRELTPKFRIVSIERNDFTFNFKRANYNPGSLEICAQGYIFKNEKYIPWAKFFFAVCYLPCLVNPPKGAVYISTNLNAFFVHLWEEQVSLISTCLLSHDIWNTVFGSKPLLVWIWKYLFVTDF